MTGAPEGGFDSAGGARGVISGNDVRCCAYGGGSDLCMPERVSLSLGFSELGLGLGLNPKLMTFLSDPLNQ
eukprot:2506679-Pyramimonas_sp.AAC.2